jgi:hypothetical protein
MPRSLGFDVMDVSTSVCDDPKFRRLQREAPEHVAVAFTAYIATMAESWKAGRRVSIEDGWPAFLPFDRTVIDLLVSVGLLDSSGLVSPKAWRSWFEPARKRRQKARERWTRYNANRDADTTVVPRGSDAGTATSVPSVRPSGPSDSPSAPSTARTRGKKDDSLTSEERRKERERLGNEYNAGRITVEEYEQRYRELSA